MSLRQCTLAAKHLAVAALVLVGTLSSAQLGAASPPSIEDFFRPSAYASVTLSPDGKTLAALAPINDRANIAVVDVQTRKGSAVTSLKGAEVSGYRWINSRRLLFWIVQNKEEDSERIYHGGAYAVDIDGGRPRDLRGLSYLASVALLEGEDPNSDEIVAWVRDSGVDRLVRLNTVTDRTTPLVDQAPGPSPRWVLDRAGVPRAAMTHDRQTLEWGLWFRPTAAAPWQRLEGGQGLDDLFRDISHLSFDYRGNLIVSARINDDRAGLFYYDVAKRAIGEKIADHPDVDVDDGLVYDAVKKALVGLRVEATKPEFYWIDDEWARWQAAVNRALPGRINELTRARTGSLFIVRSYSDREPGTYYLFDPQAQRLEEVLRSRPWINPETMAEVRPLRYRARDGLSIPAYLTLPPGREARGLPLVVLVHGGPYVRGELFGWDPRAQFLASRGYAVLQADFRGSTGYGYRHYAAGFKQWGRAMQDDLNDGVLHLAANGIVDPRRACIMGGSYGGYAAMMGVARDPDFWRCAISFAGVADLELMVNIAYADYSYSKLNEPWNRIHIGDPTVDKEYFEASSPERQAHRVKAPVLLAIGTDDRRVPLENGTRMKRAYEKHGVAHEWILYDAAVHGFTRDAHEFDYMGRVERFLRTHLPP